MSDETTVSVNFGKPMPIFPLNAVVLLPHGVLPLHIFEDRYRQMVSDALDAAGQIAMAVFEGEEWKQQYHARPPLRPAVCVGQIVQHHKLPDGRYNLALQGICRARIAHELPATGEQLYRSAMLEPLGPVLIDEEALAPARERLASMLAQDPLTDLRDAGSILQHLSDDDIPTSAILELLTLSFVGSSETRYSLLAQGDPVARAGVLEGELARLSRLLSRARPQREVETPKGVSWN